MELLNRLTSGAHENEGQHGVQHAGQTCQNHPAAETPRAQHVLSVGFAYRRGVFSERAAQVHEGHAIGEAGVRGCEAMAIWCLARNNIALSELDLE